MSETSRVLELIDQLLQMHSPELGARLKQRLNEVLVQTGEARFNERLLGFKKFSEFLRGYPDRWIVEQSSVDGDISVRLRSATAVKPMPAPLSAKTNDIPSFRNDVWQAFANPDSKRKRFWDKEQNIVKHYVEDGDHSSLHQLIISAPQRYVQINPVAGADQSSWMKEFLHSLPLHEKDRAPVEAMVDGQYTSSINATFTRALGAHGEAWRRFRTDRITTAIDEWAKSFNIDANLLRKQTETPIASERVTDAPTASLRTKIHKLMELVSDDDLERLILPALLTTISLRASK